MKEWAGGDTGGEGSNIRRNVSICCTDLPPLPPLRSSDTGIDENNLVGRKPRGDPNWRESSCR